MKEASMVIRRMAVPEAAVQERSEADDDEDRRTIRWRVAP
jgi:hypothetical protein